MSDFDLIIIGGGPAGLTAGLYAARANMNAVLFEAKDVGGEILNTELIEDYPGFASVTGADLATKMADHARKFGLRIETYTPVKEIRLEGDRKIVELEDGTTHTAYAVIVTVGGEPTKLGVPGEAEFHGKGVSYCAVCDGAFFKNSDLAVIGGGDSAFQEGLFLTRFAKTLKLVHRRSEYRAQAILQDRLLGMEKVSTVTPAVVTEIGGDEAGVKWMDVERDGKTERHSVEGVFIFVGFKPVGRHLFPRDHIEHDQNDYLITDQFMQTSIPGVYAAGDTRAQLAKQVTTAVGDATTAVLHAERYIEELKHAEKVFPQVPKDVIVRATEGMRVLTFAPGQVVIRKGDMPDALYVVTKGEAVVVERDDNGVERVVNTVKEDQYFGEIGMLRNEPRNATVRARTSLEVIAVSRDSFNMLVKSSNQTADEIARVAQERMGPAATAR
jgi:thioredoxin reductase (NADPH)